MDNKEKALRLADRGIYVFPVSVKQKPGNPYRTTKKPLTEHGFLDATTDADKIEQWWSQFKDAHVGVWAGKSNLHFVDCDVKRAPDDTVEIDGLNNLYEEMVYDLPETFAFDSVSGAGGVQYVYRAPEGSKAGPSQDYRGIKGVDMRAGDSYSVWAGEVPDDLSVLAEAPQWALDEKEAREADPFDGPQQEWFDALVAGEPSVAVTRTMERVEKAFQEQGEDLTHQQIVEFQHNAVRLGSEGNPGVQQLLDLIKDKTLERTGSHSRTPEEYEHEFYEALASGIRKHGALTELVTSMPAYSLDLLPGGFPDRLIQGTSRDRNEFSEVLRHLVNNVDDDNRVRSLLWSLPSTRDLAREWGLEFIAKRIKDARKNPEPVKENPSLEAVSIDTTPVAFLTREEREYIKKFPTFIDYYLEVSARKGYLHEKYSIPAAWSLLSAVLGDSAWTPTDSGYLGLNLWFTVLGPSGSGKSVEHSFLHSCLRVYLEGGETTWEIGADDSPEGMTEALLARDGLTSIMVADEAAQFYESLHGKDWKKGLMQKMSKFYDGFVPPENKVRLKDLKGKSALTSFGVYMSSTPAKLLPHVTSSMFESGFLARMLWSWDESVMEYDESRFMLSKPSKGKEGVNPGVYELLAELASAKAAIGKERVELDWGEDVVDFMFHVNRKMDDVVRARLDDPLKYESFGRPSCVRLTEVMLKCAGLLALWRGETIIRKVDIMQAAYYAEDWFNTLFKVVAEAGKSEFLTGADEILAFIEDKKGVSRAQILTRFGHLIDRGGNRDVDMRIDYLMDSGKIYRDEKGRYFANGSRKKEVDDA